MKEKISYNIKKPQEIEIRFTAVSRIKHLDFGLQNWWTLEERAVLAACVFKDWKYLRNKVVLLVKQIAYFLHFLLLYVLLDGATWKSFPHWLQKNMEFWDLIM